MSSSATCTSDKSLAQAFQELIDRALDVRDTQATLFPSSPVGFSYLLTPKQFDRITRICRHNNWPVPNCRGILIDLQAIAHPLHARKLKDNCTPVEVFQILTSAYSIFSQAGLNTPKYAQCILFNTGRKVKIGTGSYYAVAVLKVCEEGSRRYLAPVTAYHATEAKIRNIT